MFDLGQSTSLEARYSMPTTTITAAAFAPAQPFKTLVCALRGFRRRHFNSPYSHSIVDGGLELMS
jgi:hypothetical protein